VSGEWIATTEIFSGRSNPEWQLEIREAESLVDLWKLLPQFKDDLPIPPTLGYRGCYLRDVFGDREWYAFGGVVSLEKIDGADRRVDEARQFERRLLGSAPSGMLPDSVPGSLKF
jgi:hypothetical protein